MPRAGWANLAASWGKPGINPPLLSRSNCFCPALTLCSSQPCGTMGGPSAPAGPRCSVTPGVVPHPSGDVLVGEVSPSPLAPSHRPPRCPGEPDGAASGGAPHPANAPAPSLPPSPRSWAEEGLLSQTLPWQGQTWAGRAGVLPPHGAGLGGAATVPFSRRLSLAPTKAPRLLRAPSHTAAAHPRVPLRKAHSKAPTALRATVGEPPLSLPRFPQAPCPKTGGTVLLPARRQAPRTPGRDSLHPSVTHVHSAPRWLPSSPRSRIPQDFPPFALGRAGGTGLTSGRGSRAEGLGVAGQQQQRQQQHRGDATSGTDRKSVV